MTATHGNVKNLAIENDAEGKIEFNIFFAFIAIFSIKTNHVTKRIQIQKPQ